MLVTLGFFLYLSILDASAQVRNQYVLSLNNALHHEAEIAMVFPNLQPGKVVFRMRRTSPDQSGLHEFSKNIYDLKFTNSKGKQLQVTTLHPYQWEIAGHEGEIHIKYKVFADQGDGTHSQCNANHAIINPASVFIYAPVLKDRPIELRYDFPPTKGWSVASQLKNTKTHSFIAQDLSELMDSPALIGKLAIKQKDITVGASKHTIRLVSEHRADGEKQTDFEIDPFFNSLLQLAEEQKNIFGDYPSFDHHIYQFLVTHTKEVTTDRSGHRNSALITCKKTNTSDLKQQLPNIAMAFFKSWNAKRMVPRTSLDWHDDKITRLDGLWFSDGFANYYAYLSLCRSGLITVSDYLNHLSAIHNRVWNSPALKRYNCIALSKQAAMHNGNYLGAPLNARNHYISPVDYGHMLALALDLSLRDQNLSLDGFMKLMYTKYGKTETPYTIENIFLTLTEYSGRSLTDDFFEDYIYKSTKPDYKKLLGQMAIYLKSDKKGYIGASLTWSKSGLATLSDYSIVGSPIYIAGLEKGDVLISVDNKSFSSFLELRDILTTKIGKKTSVNFRRNGREKSVMLRVEESPKRYYTLYKKPNKKALEKRAAWLKVAQ